MLTNYIKSQIVYYFGKGWGIMQTARYLSVSRYRVGYYANRFKKKPKPFIMENVKDNYFIKSEKLRIQDDILKGRVDLDNPVKTGRELRRLFVKAYKQKPESY